MNDQITGQPMPMYQCHKRVHAVKIIGVLNSPPDVVVDGGSWDLEIDGGGFVRVTHAWRLKHNPKEGGYYVVYDDGYASFSPAEAFEAGYTRVDA